MPETLKKAFVQAESQHATPTPGKKKQWKDGATDNARREGVGKEKEEEGEGKDSHKGQKGHSLYKENRQGDQSSNLHGEGPPGKPARKQKTNHDSRTYPLHKPKGLPPPGSTQGREDTHAMVRWEEEAGTR